jgi:hypothetical protein
MLCWFIVKHLLLILMFLNIILLSCDWSLDQSSRRWPNRNHVLKQVRVPCLKEIISKYSISFILAGLTFETIESPIGPVDVSLSQIPDQIVPGNIFGIIAKLAQKVRIA